MTNTIEVPVDLIQSGDIAAIRDLLPKQNLFGRWVTHPKYGRGVIINAHPDRTDLVLVACERGESIDDADWDWINLEDLAFAPVELSTLKDFKSALIGTVVAESLGNAHQKTDLDQWESLDGIFTNKDMENKGPWKILREGWGE